MIAVASRVAQIPPPATLAINARVKAMQASGRDMVNLSVGEPDFPTPARICQAAARAMEAGHTRYTDVQGIKPLRDAVVAQLQRTHGLKYGPEQVLVSNGGKQCLYNVFQTVLEPGDEVIVPTPCWLTYPPQIQLAEGVPVFLETLDTDGFQIDTDRLEGLCTHRTRAILLNSPCNPTGVVYRKDVLERIARIAVKHDLVVVTDDLYQPFLYGDQPFISVASLHPDMMERTLVVGGVSKSYAMTGWRIGYTAGPRPLINAMTTLQGQSTSNACSISQYAALEAINGAGGDEEVAAMVGAFAERRKAILARLADIPQVTCVAPEGAFYVFPNVSAYYGRSHNGQAIVGSLAMCAYLVEEVGLAGVPGLEFGADAHIRFSYACSMETLEEGMRRLADGLARLKA